MCFVQLLARIYFAVQDFKILGLISARFGGGVMMAVILSTGIIGLRIIRHYQDPQEAMKWAALSMSGDPRARPEDALTPLVRSLAGFMLLVPGLLTDALGLLLLTPMVARPLARSFMKRGAGAMGGAGGPFGGAGGPFGGAGGPFGGAGGPFGGAGGPFGGAGGSSQPDEPEEEQSGGQGRRQRRGAQKHQSKSRSQSSVIDVSGEVVSPDDERD
jgi:UPF0716 family protein affecting phage T7 exclusion